MRINKWVDMGAEVEIEISVDDVRGALAECFAAVTEDRLGEPPNIHDVTKAFNQIGAFLNAVTDEQIALLNDKQRETIGAYLTKQAARFSVRR